MTPKDFFNFCHEKAKEAGLSSDRIFLGGDHLGPLTVANKPEAEAMEYAKTLVHDYVRAGFTKIHIDTSMKVADDDPNTRLSDETIARRGATLAKVCEEAYQELLQENPEAIHPVYIVGSEVPIPGGAQEENAGMQVTKPEDFKSTVATFEKHLMIWESQMLGTTLSLLLFSQVLKKKMLDVKNTIVNVLKI